MNPGFTASRIGHWDLVIPARPNDFAIVLGSSLEISAQGIDQRVHP